MPKTLVTGVAGFIGSHVADRCLQEGFGVVGLDDLSGGFAENVPVGVDFVHGSVTDVALVEALVAAHRFDYIYHLAAYAAEGLSHFIRSFNYRTNLLGSVNLINSSIRHEVKCFVFASSIAVYGKNQLPMTEDLTPIPEDPYGIGKYAVELDLRSAREMFGLNYVIFRPHNVYGERQNVADKYRNVVGIFMNQLLRKQPMTIFGDGRQTRAFSYVGDIVGPIVQSALRPECSGEVFNVGADTPYTVLELATEVATAMRVPTQIEFLPPRNEVDHAYASHEKLSRFFGKQESVSLHKGLATMAEWVRRTGPRRPIEFSGIEIERNLPPSWSAV